MAGQWNPYAVLNINKTRSRCYGWAPSKGRLCENPIAMANRNEAHRLISRLARLSPSDDEVMELLSHVARCLLCRNRHQGQARSVLDGWEQRIDTITESSTVEGDEEHDEGEEEDDNDGSESEEDMPRADQRRQMTEIHELLRRIETALVANQRRVGVSVSTSSDRHDQVNHPEVSMRGNQTLEAGNSGILLNQSRLNDALSRQRQRSTENEATQQQGLSSPTAEASEVTGATADPVTSRSSSPQALMGDDSDEPGRVRQATEEPLIAAVVLPVVEDFVPDPGNENESSDTVVEDTVLRLERERVDMGSRSSKADSNASTSTARFSQKDDTPVERHAFLCQDILHGFWLPDPTPQARRNTNPLWLTILIVYVGAVTIWHLLGPNQTYLRTLGLPVSVSHVRDRAADPLRLDGPSIPSVDILKCY